MKKIFKNQWVLATATPLYLAFLAAYAKPIAADPFTVNTAQEQKVSSSLMLVQGQPINQPPLGYLLNTKLSQDTNYLIKSADINFQKTVKLDSHSGIYQITHDGGGALTVQLVSNSGINLVEKYDSEADDAILLSGTPQFNTTQSSGVEGYYLAVYAQETNTAGKSSSSYQGAPSPSPAGFPVAFLIKLNVKPAPPTFTNNQYTVPNSDRLVTGVPHNIIIPTSATQSGVPFVMKLDPTSPNQSFTASNTTLSYTGGKIIPDASDPIHATILVDVCSTTDLSDCALNQKISIPFYPSLPIAATPHFISNIISFDPTDNINILTGVNGSVWNTSTFTTPTDLDIANLNVVLDDLNKPMHQFTLALADHNNPAFATSGTLLLLTNQKNMSPGTDMVNLLACTTDGKLCSQVATFEIPVAPGTTPTSNPAPQDIMLNLGEKTNIPLNTLYGNMGNPTATLTWATTLPKDVTINNDLINTLTIDASHAQMNEEGKYTVDITAQNIAGQAISHLTVYLQQAPTPIAVPTNIQLLTTTSQTYPMFNPGYSKQGVTTYAVDTTGLECARTYYDVKKPTFSVSNDGVLMVHSFPPSAFTRDASNGFFCSGTVTVSASNAVGTNYNMLSFNMLTNTIPAEIPLILPTTVTDSIQLANDLTNYFTGATSATTEADPESICNLSPSHVLSGNGQCYIKGINQFGSTDIPIIIKPGVTPKVIPIHCPASLTVGDDGTTITGNYDPTLFTKPQIISPSSGQMLPSTYPVMEIGSDGVSTGACIYENAASSEWHIITHVIPKVVPTGADWQGSPPTMWCNDGVKCTFLVTPNG